MGSNPRAVVFDLDGTLVDSAPDIAAALNATLVAEGLDALGLGEVKAMVGGGARTLIERALARQGCEAPPGRVTRLLEDFLTRYSAEPCVRTVFYPGAREVLEALAKAGVALGICTNKPADLTELVLAGLGVRVLFASVVAATPELPPKPAPEMLLAVLRQLAVVPGAAVMVGDSAADVGVARAAGVRCIVMSHGYSAVPASDLGADAVVADFAGLAPRLASPRAGPPSRL